MNDEPNKCVYILHNIKKNHATMPIVSADPPDVTFVDFILSETATVKL